MLYLHSAGARHSNEGESPEQPSDETVNAELSVSEQPLEGYAVDVCIPNEAFVGGYEYENVILFPDQFVLNGSQFVREQSENFSTVALETVETKA